MNIVKLHYPKDKKYKNIENLDVFVNIDKIRFMRRKIVSGNDAYTEIWFDSKDSIIVTETPDEIDSLIKHYLQDETGKELIKFKDNFDKKEYEDFIKREG